MLAVARRGFKPREPWGWGPVEPWAAGSMVIPWVGLTLGDLLARCKPTAKAKYVAFETLLDPKQMPGQRRGLLDWPYR